MAGRFPCRDTGIPHVGLTLLTTATKVGGAGRGPLSNSPPQTGERIFEAMTGQSLRGIPPPSTGSGQASTSPGRTDWDGVVQKFPGDGCAYCGESAIAPQPALEHSRSGSGPPPPLYCATTGAKEAYGPTCAIDRHRRRRRVGRGRRPAEQVRAPAARRGRVQRPRGRRPWQERRRRSVHGWLLHLQHGRVSRHQPHLHRQHDGRRLVVRDPRRPRGRGNRGRLLRGRPHHPRTGRPQRSGAPACGPEPPVVAIRCAVRDDWPARQLLDGRGPLHAPVRRGPLAPGHGRDRGLHSQVGPVEPEGHDARAHDVRRLPQFPLDIASLPPARLLPRDGRRGSRCRHDGGARSQPAEEASLGAGRR